MSWTSRYLSLEQAEAKEKVTNECEEAAAKEAQLEDVSG